MPFCRRAIQAYLDHAATSACQEWTGRRFEIMGEDGNHLLVDMQSFMETGAHLMSSGSSMEALPAAARSGGRHSFLD